MDDEGEDKPNFAVANINLIYTESSVQAQRQESRGCMASVHQSETAIVMTNIKISIPERSRKHWPGSTSGDTIYGIEAPDISKEWMVAWKEKKEILGKKHMIVLGGKTEMDDSSRQDVDGGYTFTSAQPCFRRRS